MNSGGQVDFGTGKVSKKIMSMMLPLLVAQITNLLYNIVDRLYIGHIPEIGALALTGLGLCFPIITFVTAFSNLISTGGAPLFSMERGRDNNEEAEKIMCNCFTLLIFCGIALTFLGIAFQKPLLYLFGASDATYGYASDYLTIYLCGSTFVMISLGMNSFINGQGFGRMGMLTVLIGAVINIVLDPIFIFVFDMGVKGAALATIFSQFISAVWVVKFLTGKKTDLKLKYRFMKVEWKRMRRILSLGITGFVTSATTSVVQAVYNGNLQIYGGDLYIGVMTVANSIREVLIMPVQSLNNGGSPVVSFNYGAGKYDRVKEAVRFIAVTCIIYTLLAWGVVTLFTKYIIQIFNSDVQLIAAGIPTIRIFFFGYCFMALQISGQMVFVALGKAKFAICFSVLRKIVIVTPLVFLLPGVFGLGVNGIFWAEPISNILGGTACFVTMLLTVMPELNGKKKQHLIED